MDCLQKLEEQMWAKTIRVEAFRTRLQFKPCAGLVYARLASVLKPVSDDGGYPNQIQFAQGRFDNFAAPVTRMTENGLEVAYPKDEYYFSRLGLLAVQYGREELYHDCETLYAMTTDRVSIEVLQYLDKTGRRYGADSNLWYNTMVHIYYGMIAEEHYARMWAGATEPQRTVVGKMMKMHAMHRMLVDMGSVSAASTECVSMNHQQIIQQASGMGIIRDVTWVPYSDELDKSMYLPVVPDGVKKSVN